MQGKVINKSIVPRFQSGIMKAFLDVSMLFCRKMIVIRSLLPSRLEFYIDNDTDLGGREDGKIQQKSSNLYSKFKTKASLWFGTQNAEKLIPLP